MGTTLGMSQTPKAVDEEQRLAALYRLNLLDTPADERFERITRLAALALSMPMAAISLVDRRRVWFKSVHGLTAHEFAREDSLCAHALNVEGPLLIPDLAQAPQFAIPRLAESVRSYASYPLHAPDGSRVGGLCAMDRAPRVFDHAMARTLRDLAHLVETELQISALTRAQSMLTTDLDAVRGQLLRDSLTQIWNRAGILEILSREHARARRNRERLGVALVDLDHFKHINETHGHLIGDRVLRTAADRMVDAVRPYDAVGRYGGEEFLVVIVEHEPQIIHSVAERIRHNISSAPVTADRRTFALTASVGVACVEPQIGSDIRTLVQAADDALYQAKRQGRNCVVVAA